MKDTVRVILVLAILAGCGVCVAMAAQDDDDKSAAAKLVDEKVIFKITGDKDTAPALAPGLMKLSPDGKRLLYIRGVLKRDEEGRLRRAVEVRLRTLAGGEEVVLPIPAYTMSKILGLMLSMNVFDAAGKRIVLGIGVDQNNDGLHQRREKMQPALYDIAKDKITKLDVTDDIVLPTFDRTGKGLIIIAANKKAEIGKMYTTPVDQIKLRQLALWGLLRSTCPTADVIPLLLPPKRDADGKRGKPEFVLYDLANDKTAAKLPVHERNTKLDNYNPQWTADGRYLYYVDVKMAEGGNKRVMLTRIWDRKEGKLAGEIEDAIALGPGPTKTTMVLGPYGRMPTTSTTQYGTMGSLKIHDAASGKTWQLASGQPIHPTSVTSKYILYVKSNGEGEMILYRARIALPAEKK